MKLGLLTWDKKLGKIRENLTKRGFMIVEEQQNTQKYENLKESWDTLQARTLDLMMIDFFPKDFNYFLDFINPKDFKKQKYDLIANGAATTLLNFATTINKNNRIIYGPTFHECNTESEFVTTYDKLANIISRAQPEILIEDHAENEELNFTDAVKTVTAKLYGGEVNNLLNSLNTDYQTFKFKGNILLIDGLSSSEPELRQQLTALNQKKVFVGVKSVIFGKIPNIDLQEFIKTEFVELTRLNIVYNFSGIQSKRQSYLIIGAKTKIDNLVKAIVQYHK